MEVQIFSKLIQSNYHIVLKWLNCDKKKFVIIFYRTGKILLEIPIPAKAVTSLTFGGPDLDILYVTTASAGDTENKFAGCLFQVTGLGVKGYPDVKVRV